MGLFILWAVAEGAIHGLGWFQPERQARRRAGLTWLQAAFIGSVLVGWLDATAWRLSDFTSPSVHAAGAALALPPLKWSTDNGAMIALAGWDYLARGVSPNLRPVARLSIQDF